MTKSYKVWVKGSPEKYELIHTWKPKGMAAIRQRAKDRYFKNTPLSEIAVKKVGR